MDHSLLTLDFLTAGFLRGGAVTTQLWRRRGRGGIAPTHSRPKWWLVFSVTPRQRFIPGKRSPGTHSTEGLVGSRAGLDTDATVDFYGVGLSIPRPTPNLEDQASVFMTPGDRMTQLYPQALGTHFSRVSYVGTVVILRSPHRVINPLA
jgi:hypothetical protein